MLTAMPPPGADLSPVWFRELELTGAYAASTELTADGPADAFDLAIDLAGEAPLDGVVGGRLSPRPVARGAGPRHGRRPAGDGQGRHSTRPAAR